MKPWTSELQPERTALAWGRSWLTLVCASLVVVRDAFMGGAYIAMGAAAVAGAVWACLATRVPVHYRRRTRALAEGGRHEVVLSATLAAAGTTLLCLAALTVAVGQLR